MDEPLFCLGNKKEAERLGRRVRSIESTKRFREAFQGNRRGRWIAFRENVLSEVLREVREPRETWHRILVLEPPSAGRIEFLRGVFRTVIVPGNEMVMLPADDVVAVLKSNHPEDYFVGGTVDQEDERVILYRGTLEWMAVPFKFFDARAGVKPDFGDFEITDCGQTLRFGEYEAASDAILYAFDTDSRKRMKKNEIENDPSFGAALRRLRLLKGVSREDFLPGVSAKTIARIERGDVKNPHDETIAAIAARLDVLPKDIESY